MTIGLCEVNLDACYESESSEPMPALTLGQGVEQNFQRVIRVPQKSLTDQLSPDVPMSLELARSHALANPEAVGAEPGTALDEEIYHVIIERQKGITPEPLGFEHDSLGARRFEDLADRSVRVTDRLRGHGNPPR
jgi:hypothetical protein